MFYFYFLTGLYDLLECYWKFFGESYFPWQQHIGLTNPLISPKFSFLI